MIESDEDFVKKRLYEMDIDELDKLPDKRVSGFWKMSWLEVFLRLVMFVGIVYINEEGYMNPHHPKFLFAKWEIKEITYDPFPEDLPEDGKQFDFWGWLPLDPNYSD